MLSTKRARSEDQSEDNPAPKRIKVADDPVAIVNFPPEICLRLFSFIPLKDIGKLLLQTIIA